MEKLRKDDPEKIGPYDIVARLGSGGMGVVFLGTKGADRVAIKVVRSSYLDDPSLKTGFVREIETLQKVESPYVAKFLDSTVDGEIAWHAVDLPISIAPSAGIEPATKRLEVFCSIR